MQVLGELLLLPNGHDLPLPWWHRAPLGLMDKTTVHIAVTARSERPCGDILVSVIDCKSWDSIVRLDVTAPDKDGVLSTVFGTIHPLNIALAESATVISCENESERFRRSHAVTLFCEPKLVPPGDVAKTKSESDRTLREAGYEKRVWSSPQFPRRELTYISQVQHGWVRDLQWRREIEEHFKDTVHECDLTRAVVSADTKQRVVRFVFPLKGAANFKVTHRDEPGVLRKLTSLFEGEANILSALLKRGGAPPESAQLDLIVEPLKSSDTSMATRMERKLVDFRRKQPDLRIKLGRVSRGRLCSNGVIFPTHPDSVIAQPPAHLTGQIIQLKKEYSTGGKTPIFVSRRFIENDLNFERLKDEVHSVLDKLGCAPIEATINTKDKPRTPDVVEQTMWACSGGILFVAATKNRKERALTPNMTQEYGFMKGQGKPILLLAETGCDQQINRFWSNSTGISSTRFSSGEGAFDRKSKRSIYRIIEEWAHDHEL